MVASKVLFGGFPGYDGPAPPRAMRSSRGRGEAARRQSVVVPHKGRFELLATVAGRILQDTGVNEGQDKLKANERESLKENSPSEIDSQVSSVGSVTNHIFTDKRQSATVLCVAPTVVVPGQLVMNEEELQVAGAKKNEGVVGQGENSFENFRSEAAVCSLSQEEQSKAVEKVTLVDQDKAIGEVMAMLDGPVTVMNEASSSIPEFQSSESGDFMKLASPIYLQEDKDEENVSMEMEDKGIVVNEKTPPSVATSGCSKFVSSGLAEGHNSRPMLKRVMCKRDVKFSRTKKMNSSQHLLQETMTKKLKNSYSKASDAQKVAKAVKCTHLSKTNIKRHHTDMESTDSGSSQVTLSIKSFTVPELFVDLPESASILNLKRAVMEAAMNLLGGGLRVRVLLQGKKVPDEGVTLLQMGISPNTKPESLGFMLEPSPLPTSSSATAEDPLLVLSHAASPPLPRYANHCSFSAHSMRVPVPGALAAIHAQMDTSCQAKNELDPTSTVTSNISQESFEGESGAIVLHPSMGTGDNLPGLALVPVRQKMSCALEVGKRRMRRPFSVAEVEALVHAVEKLGTGRWRDVKLRAFDQAKHRTYVDLKDKWKTLVHTARIAPHQRRGEPVPQELLERVIQAHSYWTAQAAKQQAELDS
ncbi:unnamed protein product [Sphagnum jensenii]|uniref:Uncharacterized protein n=1 Tax=Sphagnum jensenii TaxID=128206 RepID=A0ABP1ABN8_9BRYO